jgi:hypothetical protein
VPEITSDSDSLRKYRARTFTKMVGENLIGDVDRCGEGDRV